MRTVKSNRPRDAVALAMCTKQWQAHPDALNECSLCISTHPPTWHAAMPAANCGAAALPPGAASSMVRVFAEPAAAQAALVVEPTRGCPGVLAFRTTKLLFGLLIAVTTRLMMAAWAGHVPAGSESSMTKQVSNRQPGCAAGPETWGPVHAPVASLTHQVPAGCTGRPAGFRCCIQNNNLIFNSWVLRSRHAPTVFKVHTWVQEGISNNSPHIVCAALPSPCPHAALTPPPGLHAALHIGQEEREPLGSGHQHSTCDIWWAGS